MKNIVLLVVISTIIQGCSNIVQPSASRPLVAEVFATPAASVDVTLSAALSTSKSGTSLLVEEKPLVIGERFFAATGLTCRKLTSEHAGQHIYCLNIQGNWFEVKRVISEYHENIVPEVSL